MSDCGRILWIIILYGTLGCGRSYCFDVDWVIIHDSKETPFFSEVYHPQEQYNWNRGGDLDNFSNIRMGKNNFKRRDPWIYFSKAGKKFSSCWILPPRRDDNLRPSDLWRNDKGLNYLVFASESDLDQCITVGFKELGGKYRRTELNHHFYTNEQIVSYKILPFGTPRKNELKNFSPRILKGPSIHKFFEHKEIGSYDLYIPSEYMKVFLNMKWGNHRDDVLRKMNYLYREPSDPQGIKKYLEPRKIFPFFNHFFDYVFSGSHEISKSRHHIKYREKERYFWERYMSRTGRGTNGIYLVLELEKGRLNAIKETFLLAREKRVIVSVLNLFPISQLGYVRGYNYTGQQKDNVDVDELQSALRKLEREKLRLEGKNNYSNDKYMKAETERHALQQKYEKQLERSSGFYGQNEILKKELENAKEALQRELRRKVPTPAPTQKRTVRSTNTAKEKPDKSIAWYLREIDDHREGRNKARQERDNVEKERVEYRTKYYDTLNENKKFQVKIDNLKTERGRSFQRLILWGSILGVLIIVAIVILMMRKKVVRYPDITELQKDIKGARSEIKETAKTTRYLQTTTSILSQRIPDELITALSNRKSSLNLEALLEHLNEYFEKNKPTAFGPEVKREIKKALQVIVPLYTDDAIKQLELSELSRANEDQKKEIENDEYPNKEQRLQELEELWQAIRSKFA